MGFDIIHRWLMYIIHLVQWENFFCFQFTFGQLSYYFYSVTFECKFRAIGTETEHPFEVKLREWTGSSVPRWPRNVKRTRNSALYEELPQPCSVSLPTAKQSASQSVSQSWWPEDWLTDRNTEWMIAHSSGTWNSGAPKSETPKHNQRRRGQVTSETWPSAY